MSSKNRHVSNDTLISKIGSEDMRIYYQKIDEYDSLADDLKAMEDAIKEIREDIDTAKGTKYWDGSYIVRRRLEMRYIIKLENKISFGIMHQDLLNAYGIN